MFLVDNSEWYFLSQLHEPNVQLELLKEKKMLMVFKVLHI